MSCSIDYRDLNNETQEFINKTIEVFLALKDKDISLEHELKTITRKINLADYEKKLFSLLIAGFLVEGNLKDLLSQFDIFELDNLLDCFCLKIDDIKTLDINYEELYDKQFKFYIFNNLKQIEEEPYDIECITPSLLLYVATYKNDNSLDYFIYTYDKNNKYSSYDYHPLKSSLKNMLTFEGTIKKKDSNNSKRKFTRTSDIWRSDLSSIFSMPDISRNDKIEDLLLNAENALKAQKKKAFQIDDNLWKISDELKQKYIGQEDFCDALFDNIVNNQEIIDRDDVPNSEISLIFVDGPSGTGKTSITKDITAKLGIPFKATSITEYSAAGYHGGDLTNLLVALYKNANGDLEKAQRGIIVIDEIDKLSFFHGGLEMRGAVQDQLLDFLGGGEYDINVGGGLFPVKVKFDTSKVTFVCLGALTELRSKKTMKKNTIGFNQSIQDSNDSVSYSITPKDLIDSGLKKELVGRFNTYLHTEDYDKAALKRILIESVTSPMIGFEKLVEGYDKELIIEDEVYDLIAEQAYELNTGARSLQTVMNGIRTIYLRKIMRYKENTIYLDAEAVNYANTKAMTRKERR